VAKKRDNAQLKAWREVLTAQQDQAADLRDEIAVLQLSLKSMNTAVEMTEAKIAELERGGE
jgi:septal ring factor EnvC (AmiA/AmiB activator)